MGKNNRHKKNLKTERSKVKLKSKTLPKGTNVTNTTFKVKKIIIGEQLKNVGENIVSLTTQIKDCLSKLRHHNHKVCLGSLQNLKTILSKYSIDMINNQFSSILKNLAHLTTNEERDVRRESFTVLLALLEPIADENETTLMPYYDMLASYLCCAMTHIDARIQNDSLLFLDVLLKVVPSFIVENYSKILDNFLDMISKLRREAKPERSLTLNLNTTLSTVKWRVKVLQRLQYMLKVLIDIRTDDGEIKRDDCCYETNIREFSEKEPIYLGVYDDNYLKVSQLGLFSGPRCDSSQPLVKENILESKVVTLMPLLFETWLEVKLNNTKDSSGCYILDLDSSSLLMCIMEIMVSLQYLIKQYGNETKSSTDWFFKKYTRDFTNYIVDGFPYSHISSVKRSKTLDARNSIDCLKQNLSICYIFILFHSDVKLKQIQQCEIILDYIAKCLHHFCGNAEYLNDLCQIVQDILYCLFFQVAPKWCSVGLSLGVILESLVEILESNPKSNLRNIIFKILCEVSQDIKLKQLYENITYSRWLQGLPSMLSRSKLYVNEIPYLSMLARNNNILFLQNMEIEFSNILDALSYAGDSKLACSIISILYYMPKLSVKKLDNIRHAIEISNVSVDDKVYLQAILNKLQQEKN